jgi:hypothetical protein
MLEIVMLELRRIITKVVTLVHVEIITVVSHDRAKRDRQSSIPVKENNN